MIGIAETAIGIFGKVLDKFVSDKDQRNQLKTEVALAILQSQNELNKVASENIKAEITGASWMQRNWRPLLMMVIITIVANNFLIAPYVNIFTGVDIFLDLPEKLYELMVIGVGGYTLGRSGEKMMQSYNNNKQQ